MDPSTPLPDAESELDNLLVVSPGVLLTLCVKGQTDFNYIEFAEHSILKMNVSQC